MRKRKTHEEYVVELAIKNPTIEVIDEYIGYDTKILHHCLIHNVYWEISPNNALRGKGCKICQKFKYKEKRVKTYKQYTSELLIKNPHIEVIGEYIDNRTPILHRCLKHDVYWMISPTNALRGKGCNMCMREKISNALVKTHEEYVSDLALKVPTVEVVDKYINSSTPITHHCLKHNIYWKVSPNNVLNGEGCSECAKEKYQKCLGKTNEQYINEVALVNPDIEVVGEYVNSHTPILHKCKIDGYEWMSTPTNILVGRGCPQCKESNGERNIRLWLEDNKIEYEQEKSFIDCRDKYPLPFDFYLPKYNAVIEYQGQQHYHPVEIFGGEKVFKIQQKHDDIKRKYCYDNNIELLEIPYFKDIKEELNNFLFI